MYILNIKDFKLLVKKRQEKLKLNIKIIVISI